VRRIITEENSLFRVLMRSNPPVQWDPLPLDRIIPLAPLLAGAKDGLFCKAVSLFGSFPDYARDSLKSSFPLEEAVIGLQLVHKEKRLSTPPAFPASEKTHSVPWMKVICSSRRHILEG